MITKFKLFENHLDVDPYGEEIWENENSNKIDKIKIIEALDTMTDDEIVAHLNENFTGEEIHVYGKDLLTGYSRVYGDVQITPNKFEKVRPFNKETKRMTEVIRVHFNKTITREIFIDDKILKPKRIFTEEDPYGEEDWEDMSERNKIKSPSIVLYKKAKMNIIIGIYLAQAFINIFRLLNVVIKDSETKSNMDDKIKDLNHLKYGIRKIVKFLNSGKILSILDKIDNSNDQDECQELIGIIKTEYTKKYKKNLITDIDEFINIIRHYEEWDNMERELKEIKVLLNKIRIGIDPYGEENWED